MRPHVAGEASTFGPCRSPSGQPGIGAVVKRVLNFRDRSDVPVTIVRSPRTVGDLLLEDIDTWAPTKPCTDVIVRGSLRGTRPGPALDGSVTAGGVTRRVRVHAERRVRVRGGGVTFERIGELREATLDYENAYGGAIGGQKRRRLGFGRDRINDIDPSYYSYPRNPVGRGFALLDNALAMDDALAPSQEDPDDAVSPERLLRRTPLDWQTAPSPGGFGPIHMAWFPRAHWLIPFTKELVATDLREVRVGAMSFEDTQRPTLSMDARVLSCAATGLGVPLLEPGQRVQLSGFRWGNGAVDIALDQAPRIRFRFPSAGEYRHIGALKTVLIDADEERVTLVWGAFQPTACLYDDVALSEVSFANLSV